MMARAWNAQERNKILAAMADTKARRDAAAEREDWDADRAFLQAQLKLDAQYSEGLPRVVMGCCPFDGKPLVRTFDPVGLDGPWWGATFTTDEPPACPHFCILSGAVSYQGLPPRAGDFEVFPGPEAPYVYSRVLALPGVIAVVSSLPMENGYLAYPVAYFAQKRPPPEELAADWRRDTYYWVSQLGKGADPRMENDLWDFDLLPWAQQGKLRWTPPGSDRTVLSEDPAEQCPYLGLPGEHKRVTVYRDRFGYRALPTGVKISTFSPYEA